MKSKLSNIYTQYSVLFCFILLSAFYITLPLQADEIISSEANPIKVVDGDSLEIGSHRIRLTGIDAPEYHQYCKTPDKKSYPCGKQSLTHLKNLIKDTQVKCIIHKKDKYNRDLCTCYANNTNLNAEMVRSGYAIVYLQSDYQTEQSEAKVHKRGIWNGKFIHPRLFRRLQEEKRNK